MPRPTLWNACVLLIAALAMSIRVASAAPKAIECPHVNLGAESRGANELCCLQLASDPRGSYAAWLRGASQVRCEVMRLDSLGRPAWPAEVVASPGARPWKTRFTICPDGSGGVLIAWLMDPGSSHGETSRVTLQRIDHSGRRLWGSGTVLAGSRADLAAPTLVPCVDGGAIVAWCKAPSWDSRVAAQRLDGGGRPQWRNELLTPYHALQYSPVSASDDSGGAVVFWLEGIRRHPRPRGYEPPFVCGVGLPPNTAPGPWLHAQRIDVLGRARWGIGGIVLSDTASQAGEATVTSTTDDRIHVLWPQYLVERGAHVRSLEASSGREIWRAAFTGPNAVRSGFHHVAPDASGGTLISWTVDEPARQNDRSLIVQRVDASGYRLWGEQGLVLGEPGAHFESTITSDGVGGAYVASAGPLIAYHVDSTGNVSRATPGIPLCPGGQYTTDLASMPFREGEGIVVWLHRGLTEQFVIQLLGPQGITSPERAH